MKYFEDLKNSPLFEDLNEMSCMAMMHCLKTKVKVYLKNQVVCFRIERKFIPSHKYVSFQKLPVLWEEVHFAKDCILVILPFVSFVSREALDVFLGIAISAFAPNRNGILDVIL